MSGRPYLMMMNQMVGLVIWKVRRSDR